MHICASSPMLESGALGSKRSANLPTNPMGCKRSLSKEPYRDNTVMRYLTQTLNTSVKRRLARRLHAGPVTYCYGEILLVDVAPIGRPTLITGNDARFCVTFFFLFPQALFKSWCMASYSVSSILYTLPLKNFRMSMPMAFFDAPAHRPTL